MTQPMHHTGPRQDLAEIPRVGMPTAAQSREAVSQRATVAMAQDALRHLTPEDFVTVLCGALDVRRDLTESQLNEVSNHAGNVTQLRIRGQIE